MHEKNPSVQTLELSQLAAIGTLSPWFTPEEAAAYTKLSRNTIWKWIGEGKLTSYNPTARTLIARADIDKLIKDHKKR